MTDGGGKRVLVVDDDTLVRDTIVDALRLATPLEVVSAANGEEALRILADSWIDLLVVDLRMPVMDGWSLRVAQRKLPRLADIPFISMSADASPQAVAVDAAAHLTKPFSMSTLTDTVQRVLSTMERERQRAMRLAQTDRLASIGFLAAGVLHEINNPLTAVVANAALIEASLAKADAFTDERVKALNTLVREIQEASRQIQGTVHQLRTFSRVDPSGLAPVPINVRDVVERAIAMTWNEIRHRARLVTHYDEVPLVTGDEGRLTEVMINLLANAAQSMDSSRVADNELHVRVSASQQTSEVRLAVSDTGCGISAEHLPHVFDPFFSTKPGDSGTGIGLAISHDIITAHGGRIEVETSLGCGSTFTIRLPALVRPPLEVDKRVEPAEVGNRVAEGPRSAGSPEASEVWRARVLVVDDDPLLRNVIGRILGEQHDVTVTDGATSALRLLRDGARYDAILCDVMMMTMSGPALHRELLRQFPDQARRVAFMTGGAFSADARDYLESTQALQMAKPFDATRLMGFVRDCLARFGRECGDAPATARNGC